MEYVCCSYDFVSLQQNLGTQEISKKNLKNSQMADYVEKVKIAINSIRTKNLKTKVILDLT